MTKLQKALLVLSMLASAACSDSSGENMAPPNSVYTVPQGESFYLGNYGEPLAECSTFIPQQGGILGNIKFHSGNSSRNTFIARLNRVNLNSGDYLVFFVWTQDNQGNQLIYADSNNRAIALPVDVYVGGQLRNSNLRTIGANELNQGNTVDLYVKDIGTNYKALEVIQYDSNNQLVAYSDALIPAFSADPDRYINTIGQNRSFLHQIHPFYHERQNTTSYNRQREESFAYRARVDYCF